MSDRKSPFLPKEVFQAGSRPLASFSSGNNKFQVLPLDFYHKGSLPIANLAPADTCEVSGPIEPGAPGNGMEVTCPPIVARRFDLTEAVECSSALVRRKIAYVPDFCEGNEGTTLHETVFLVNQSTPKRLALILEAVRPRARNGIMLFHLGANNWYHWLIEILPMAFLAQRLPKEYAAYPFVIPKKIAQFRNFRASLELFLNGRTVVTINEIGFRFNDLIVIDPIVHGPFNLQEGIWPSREMYAYNRDLLIEYRNAILERLHIQQKSDSELIFLARENDRRDFNQAEIENIAIRHGFRLVYMERLSFPEQVELMFGAKIIVGASGAAFSNILFCHKGARILSWILPQFKGFSSFSNLAQVVGADMRYIFSEPTEPIPSSWEAYRAKYRLDPAVFENALKLALHAENY